MQIKFDDSFNWLAVLKDLAGGMEIKDKEHDRLCELARAWPTCACGQLCKNLPRHGVNALTPGLEHAPLDGSLQVKGATFFHHVASEEWSCAIRVFYEIEERTTELLLAQEDDANPRQD